jgi:multidrug efflux system membrane fusion protein
VAAGCAKPPAPKADPPPAPVAVAAAVRKTVPVQVRAIGTVHVVSTVSVRPAVAGELTAVHFREGDTVKRGQKLFSIDPRPFEAALQQAEATLARNTATLKGAELSLARLDRLGSGGISAAEADAARVAVAAAAAAVEADRAAIRAAKLQVEYTTITAPIDGRTGALLVTPGNRLTADGVSPLVVINQLSPIDVQFAVAERHLPAVRAAFEGQGKLRAEAAPRHGGPAAVGELDFVDNAVEAGTGTVVLKAQFPNADRRLWPGQFVDVVLTLGERADSVVVPAAAVRSGQAGQYVYAVTPDRRAELRPVTVAAEADGEAVVEAGLSGGETVVTDGHLRLAPGVAVEVRP